MKTNDSTLHTSDASYVAELLSKDFGESQFVVVGGRPSVGKTGFGIDVLRSASILSNKSSLFFSLELLLAEAQQRILSRESNVPLDVIVSGEMSDADRVSLDEASTRVFGANISWWSSNELSLDTFRAVCAEKKNSPEGLDVVVIDNLSLMDLPGDNSAKRREAISLLTRNLKLLASDLGITIVVLAALSRMMDTRNGEPTLADLWGSSSLEQDADTVILLHRSENDNLSAIIAKNRFGVTGIQASGGVML